LVVRGLKLALVMLALTGAPALAQGVPARPAAAVDAYAVALKPDQVDLLVRTLKAAPSHGLPAPPEAALAGDQRRLIGATLAYAKSVRSGRLDEAGFRKDWGMRPEPFNPAPEFVAAVQQDRLAEWLASLPPPYEGYAALQKGLAAYRALADKGGWQAIPAGPALKPGMSDPRVPALRARLAVEDPAVKAGQGLTYDPALVDAVRRAQTRAGLEPDGVVGKGALAALNVPVETRLGQIVANMERWRWLPRQLARDRIQVNIAAAVLTHFKDDKPTQSMRAVTGRPGDETPMLYSTIDSLVLNPPWNVPAGIAAKELYPKGSAYLAANGFQTISTPDGGRRLQQRPGPTSALGRVKFDFDNPYAVYLHDTPSQAKFESFSRLASHGCVRLQRPVELARAVLAGDAKWTPETIDAAIADGKTVRVDLPRPVAVYLLYWTAYMGADGRMNFRDDPYGWDALLLQRIAAGGSSQA
jgi:murein L,D-transpeptidase YcbB/YkuD